LELLLKLQAVRLQEWSLQEPEWQCSNPLRLEPS
jgi:hypothetical protein